LPVKGSFDCGESPRRPASAQDDKTALGNRASRMRLLVGNQAGFLVLAEHRIRAFVRGRSGQQLLFAVNQAAGVVGGQLKPVAVRNRVGGAGFHAIAAEDAAVVIDVVNLGVTLGAADPLLGGVLGRLDVNAV